MSKAQNLLATILFLFTAACGISTEPEPPAKAATHYVLVDVTASSATIENKEYAQRILDELDARVRAMQLGDTIQIIAVGGRNPANAIKRPIKLNYQRRQKAAAEEVRQIVGSIIEQNRAKGGEDTTNLIWAFERSGIQCATPNDSILAITDGLEVSSSYSAPLALATGAPVELPAPKVAYLHDCRHLEFWGLGVLSGGESLDVAQMNSLEAGWIAYAKRAGSSARPTFRSIM